jgi:DUF1680 family protein
MSHPQFNFNLTELHPSSILGKRRKVVRETTLKHQLDMLHRTGRYDAFRLKWHSSYEEPPTVWPVPNHLFWDSDIAKWIEGAAHFLQEQADPVLEQAISELVHMVQDAQQPDGYLNIHYTVVLQARGSPT